MRLLLSCVLAAAAAIAPLQAAALPVFAHRYGLSCQACHTTVPHLTAFGEAFLRNGFRLPGATHGSFPVAVKVATAYSSDADPSGLPKAVVDEVELLTGGALGSRMNYFLEQYVLDGGTAGSTRDAWLQYNAGDTHVRIGQFTLPLPVDPETQRDTLAHYLLYDQTVGQNTFSFFDPHDGVDVYGINDRGDSLHAVVSGRDVMGYGAKRIGGLTLYAYHYRGHDAFFRQGVGAGERFGKFDVLSVVQRGVDRVGLSSGGFAEAHYAFSPALTAVARYDRVWNSFDGAEHQTVLSLVTRPARNMRFTIEDQITDRHTLNVGWLFAY